MRPTYSGIRNRPRCHGNNREAVARQIAAITYFTEIS
jgi:hypothetical protein